MTYLRIVLGMISGDSQAESYILFVLSVIDDVRKSIKTILLKGILMFVKEINQIMVKTCHSQYLLESNKLL